MYIDKELRAKEEVKRIFAGERLAGISPEFASMYCIDFIGSVLSQATRATSYYSKDKRDAIHSSHPRAAAAVPRRAVQ